MCLPDYVIVMSQIKFLLVFPCVVHNSDAGDEVHDLFGGRVVQVVAALVSPVAVDPLESQMTVRSCSVSHVRTCFAKKRTAGASSFTDATSRHIQSRLSAQSAVSAASSGQRQTNRRHISVQVKCTTLGCLHNVRANALFCFIRCKSVLSLACTTCDMCEA